MQVLFLIFKSALTELSVTFHPLVLLKLSQNLGKIGKYV
ncbi:hypothetical protein P7266_0015 [Lactococcus cremoris]|nr:hypothetical protein P7266_0015 [Lactococcus cremoris]